MRNKCLFITQSFWPDTVSVAQHSYDLAKALFERGNSISVLASRYPYEGFDHTAYLKKENINGIDIKRIGCSRFKKTTYLGRVVNILTFNVNVFFSLLSISKKDYDLIAVTSMPPLLASIVMLVAKVKGIPTIYWALDLQPELSIQSGLISANSFTASILKKISDFIIKNAKIVITLDSYMKDYLVSRGAKENRVHIVPVWPVTVSEDSYPRNKNPFRIANNFNNRIVIMYSGNHSVVHPMDTLLKAAKILKNDDRFLFVFIGTGNRVSDVTNWKNKNGLNNILQLPFQPRDYIHISLTAADLQVVIMGENQVGYTHPNKFYGALFLGMPILYIGPKRSHITDILNQLPGNISVNHNEVDSLVENLKLFANSFHLEMITTSISNKSYAKKYLSSEILLDKMVVCIENAVFQN